MPEDWRKAIIVPLYRGKGKREECNNYRGISLLSVPGKIYGRILNEPMMKITDKSVGDEQGGFRWEEGRKRGGKEGRRGKGDEGNMTQWLTSIGPEVEEEDGGGGEEIGGRRSRRTGIS